MISKRIRGLTKKNFVDEFRPVMRTKGKPFDWVRTRAVGGRTLVRGCVALRLSKFDFKAASHHVYGDNEKELTKDAIDCAHEMIEAAKIELVGKNLEMYARGHSIHEVGTARMGNDPKTSVLNKWNQSHDIKNLFAVDGSCFYVERLRESNDDNSGVGDAFE